MIPSTSFGSLSLVATSNLHFLFFCRATKEKNTKCYYSPGHFVCTLFLTSNVSFVKTWSRAGLKKENFRLHNSMVIYLPSKKIIKVKSFFFTSGSDFRVHLKYSGNARILTMESVKRLHQDWTKKQKYTIAQKLVLQLVLNLQPRTSM